MTEFRITDCDDYLCFNFCFSSLLSNKYNMKRRFESGASKRRRKQADEAATKMSRSLTLFLSESTDANFNIKRSSTVVENTTNVSSNKSAECVSENDRLVFEQKDSAYNISEVSAVENINSEKIYENPLQILNNENCNTLDPVILGSSEMSIIKKKLST